MKKVILACMAVVAGWAMAGCDDDGGEKKVTPPVRIGLSADESAAVEAANSLAMRTFAATYETDKNVAFSPLSVQTALAMAANGASGETLAELKETLCPGSSVDALNSLYSKLSATLPVTDAKTRLSIANSFWHDRGFTAKTEFTGVLADCYGASVNTYDMLKPAEAADNVNLWIERATGGSIKEMLTKNDIDNFLIVNALTFKSEWAEQFDKKNTHVNKFRNIDGSKSDVYMMSGGVSGYYGRTEKFEIGELSFGNDAFRIAFVLPAEGLTPAEAMASLAANTSVLESMLSYRNISAGIPRFVVESSLELKEVYAGLGIRRAFGPDAEFDRISDSPVLIDKILHRCRVEIDEEGAKAEAATVVGGMDLAPGPDVELTLDRPFGYMIRETSTGTILFMGSVNRM